MGACSRICRRARQYPERRASPLCAICLFGSAYRSLPHLPARLLVRASIHYHRAFLFELTAVSDTAKQRSFVQADIVLSPFALGPHNFPVYKDVHVVFPLGVSASPAQVHPADRRLAENFSSFFHVLCTLKIQSLRRLPRRWAFDSPNSSH